MPTLRCVEPECSHEWFQPSWLAVGEVCPECESESELVDDEPGLEDSPALAITETQTAPQVAHARACARKLLRDHQVTEPPVPVPALARRADLEVARQSLGELRGRLRGNTIELARGFPPQAERFVIAHELGHHTMGTTHESGPHIETEADAFANELLVPGPMLHEALLHTTDRGELRSLFAVSRPVLEIAARYHKATAKLTGS